MIRMLHFEDGACQSAEKEGGEFMMPVGAGEHYHEPVLAREAVEFIVPSPGRLVVDGTLGGGGHSEAFLRAGARVIGIDQDPEASAGRGISGRSGRTSRMLNKC